MRGEPYTEAQDHLVRRMFRSGASDADIALALGRGCGAEAVRKRRHVLGLKKSPTYERWTWSPTFEECRV